MNFAKLFDYTLLSPQVTENEIISLCQEVKQWLCICLCESFMGKTFSNC